MQRINKVLHLINNRSIIFELNKLINYLFWLNDKFLTPNNL